MVTALVEVACVSQSFQRQAAKTEDYYYACRRPIGRDDRK